MTTTTVRFPNRNPAAFIKDMKRQVADYVNALTDAQRAPWVSIPAATTTRRAARAALVVDRAGSRQKAERG